MAVSTFELLRQRRRSFYSQNYLLVKLSIPVAKNETVY